MRFTSKFLSLKQAILHGVSQFNQTPVQDVPATSPPSYNPSIFTHDNTSTSTTSTIPSFPLASPNPSHEPSVMRNSVLRNADSAVSGHPESASLGCPVPVEAISALAGEVAHVPKVSVTSRPYDYKERMEMRRTLGLKKTRTAKSDLRNGYSSGHCPRKRSTPLTVDFYVIVPGCTLPFTFCWRMMSCNRYHDLAKFVADKSGETSPDKVTLFCEGYPGKIHDIDSYGKWVVWARRRDVEDRVLRTKG